MTNSFNWRWAFLTTFCAALLGACGGADTGTAAPIPPLVPVPPVVVTPPGVPPVTTLKLSATTIATGLFVAQDYLAGVAGFVVAPNSDVYWSKKVLSNSLNLTSFDLRKISPNGSDVVIASRDAQPETGTGLRSYQEANLIAFDSLGNLFIMDDDYTSVDIGEPTRPYNAVGYRPGIWKLTPDGTISAFAGIVADSPSPVPFDGTGVKGSFLRLRDMVIDTADNVYVLDQSTVRKITPAGEVITVPNQAPVVRLRKDATGAVYAIKSNTAGDPCSLLIPHNSIKLTTLESSETECASGVQAWIDKNHYLIATVEAPNVLQLKTVGSGSTVLLGTIGSANINNITTLPGTLQTISAITIGPDKAVYLTAGDALIKVTGLLPLQ